MVFNYPAQMIRARVGENLIPKFDFHIKIIHIYCFVDGEGTIVEGGDERVESFVFEFSLTYSGEFVEELGHPWSLCEIKEIEKMNLFPTPSRNYEIIKKEMLKVIDPAIKAILKIIYLEKTNSEKLD